MCYYLKLADSYNLQAGFRNHSNWTL